MNNDFYTKDWIADEFKESVGEYTYGHPEISGHGGQFLKIGKFCSIAGGVKILLGGAHDYTRFSSYPFNNVKDASENLVWNVQPSKESKELTVDDIGVFIGNDVWIGCRVTILNGVHIGDGAVIGAGAVVAKDVEPYSIVVGNPIKILKYRFNPKQIESLLKIKWWDWDIEKIKESLSIYMESIDTFIEKYEKKY